MSFIITFVVILIVLDFDVQKSKVSKLRSIWKDKRVANHHPLFRLFKKQYMQLQDEAMLFILVNKKGLSRILTIEVLDEDFLAIHDGEIFHTIGYDSKDWNKTSTMLESHGTKFFKSTGDLVVVKMYKSVL